MLKKSSLLVGMLWLAQVSWAADVSGTVRDASGAPISNVVVEVVGTNVRIDADERGSFTLDGLSTDEVELHIMAPGYVHRHIHARVGEPLELTLSRTVMEIIDIVALPWHASVLESATPVNVLAGESLRDKQGSTLGETLQNEIGVHTNYYGPVASSPIIRGLEGPRVLVTQNSLDAGDASRVGPDHAVATEASTATQIEILRGPATLLYGSGAIGGVVNVVDDRVPRSSDTRGEWLVQHNNVADENLVSGSLTSGVDAFAFHVDGFWRESNDYKIPTHAEADHADDEHDHSQRLENSAYEAQGFNVGGSYLLENGFVGLSYGRLERSYGIPGHSHDHGHSESEEDVYADLTQDRVQLHSELTLNNSYFSALNTRFGYTDYTHHEIEFGEILTTFENTSYEGRVDLFHHPLNEWRGVLSLQYKHQDFSAVGLEAFTPPSVTDTYALALIEERHFGDIQVQLGARIERVELSADRVVVDLGEHGNAPAGMQSVYAIDQVFEPFSLSAGAVWDFTYGYNVAVSLSHAQRAPSSAELLSFGPHIGTSSYEVGAMFVLHEEQDGHYHFDLNRSPIELEKSNNIDVSLRKFSGDIGFTLNAFYNVMDNFYYLQETGFFAEDDHGHDHGHSHGDEEEGLPLYVFSGRDARLYGFEGQFVLQATSPLKVTLFTDYTRATLRDGGNLPRIPPLRIGGQLQYRADNYGIELGASHYVKQDKVGTMETETDGYTLVNAQLHYYLTTAGQDITLYLQGSNLTNEEARPHTSFLKDVTPLPARAFTAGIRATF